MDRQTANKLCQAAGVADVPPGTDPQEWLDDNDVFALPADPAAGEAGVVREVYADQIAQSEADHLRIARLIDQLKARGYVHTTAFPHPNEKWTPLHQGVWKAASAAPNFLEGAYRLGDKEPYAVRHDYGNARVYYVQPSMLDSCLEVWWLDQLRTGYRVAESDPVAGIRWAATHVLELADKHANCLGGDDAERFVAKVGREKLEALTALS